MDMNAEDAERLMRTVERMVRVFRAQSVSEPLSSAAGSALNTLDGEGPQGITPLARAQGVSQPAMTQLVDRLASDGLVERRAQSDDRRSVLVTLTPAGRQAVTERRSRRSNRFNEDLDALSPAQRAAIAAALPPLEALSARMLEAIADARAVDMASTNSARTETPRLKTKKETTDT